MAVKNLRVTGKLIFNFLSRLCGGEGVSKDDIIEQYFLSRLCGGEENGLDYAEVVVFLSRLCGGEAHRTRYQI